MASYPNDNSEKYIPEKDVKEAILIKTPRPENPDPVKKLDHYLQEWVGWGVVWAEGEQKFRSNYNRKYILFQKKGPLSQQQPNFTSSYDKHVGFNSLHPILKKLFSKLKIPKCALAGKIKEFLPSWKLLTKDQELLALVEGY